MSDLQDVLGLTAGTAKPAKSAKPAKAAAKPAKAAAKPAKAAAAKPAAKPAKAAAAKPAAKPKVAPADDVSTVQPEDKVVLAAVRKLKEATLASQLAANLGVHRRVIRAQLQRLAKVKENGVKMAKDGFNWYVSPK